MQDQISLWDDSSSNDYLLRPRGTVSMPQPAIKYKKPRENAVIHQRQKRQRVLNVFLNGFDQTKVGNCVGPHPGMDRDVAHL